MKALRTLEACRSAGQTSRTLRTLEARANLQAGRVRRAFNQYLAVAHSYQGSPTGQTALYSAGRIALTRLARKSQAKRLFKHYLSTYPTGAHRANVQQMLRTL
jgi:outer membrane protein assembly factor BamD (BamD/ComL family)